MMKVLAINVGENISKPLNTVKTNGIIIIQQGNWGWTLDSEQWVVIFYQNYMCPFLAFNSVATGNTSQKVGETV